jgi:hypothetical protein
MATRRAKSITPVVQFMLSCESIEHDQEGNISFRRIFDGATLTGPPLPGQIAIAFSVSVQYRGGTGEHKHWLRIKHPGSKPDQTTDENSFWLASKLAAHRIDHRLTLPLGPNDFGRYIVTAVLDGRDAMEIPLKFEHQVIGAAPEDG